MSKIPTWLVIALALVAIFALQRGSARRSVTPTPSAKATAWARSLQEGLPEKKPILLYFGGKW